jgi:membrane-associated phospholipid phosphatase
MVALNIEGAVRRSGRASPWTRRFSPEGVAAAAIVILSALFLLVPSLDLWASGLFWSPAGFELSQSPALKALRKSSSWVLGLILLGLLVTLAAHLVRRDWTALAGARRCWFLLAGLALGPGLVVNTILKDGWGRPRPNAIEAFGGEAPYVPVWEISDWCDRNCSFVSGEAASAAWTVAAALVLAGLLPWARARTGVVVGAVIYAGALSLNRLAFGGHFLSDILLSWAITGLTLALLARVLLPAPAEARRRARRWRLRLARLARVPQGA